MANTAKSSNKKGKTIEKVKKKIAIPATSKAIKASDDKKNTTNKVSEQSKTSKSSPAKTPAKAASVKQVVNQPVKSIEKPSSKKKKAESDDEPIIEHIPIDQLPVLPSDITYKRSKGKLPPGGKRLLKSNTINPHVIKDKPIDPEKVVKRIEPKGKFEMEFILHAPIGLLYDFLTTPSGLAEWFADDVDLKNDIYSFNWDGAKQHARIVAAKLDNFIRLHWMDKPEGTYFEFRIDADELTNEIALRIVDFGENEDDIRTNRRLWDAQIQRLIKAMGSY